MYMFAKYEDATPNTSWDIWQKDETAVFKSVKVKVKWGQGQHLGQAK